jgi:hypothetical protein
VKVVVVVEVVVVNLLERERIYSKVILRRSKNFNCYKERIAICSYTIKLRSSSGNII